MRIGRTIPPAAAPIYQNDIWEGYKGLLQGASEINHFKSDLKKYFQVEHCFLVSSGKAALTLILQALHHIYPDREEVLIPAFTCYSVPSAITRAGLKVRICDISPETLDYDFTKLQHSLKNKKRLLSIVCQHLFGLPANISRVRKLLNDSEIPIIEDAAQAMGTVANNRCLGTIGDIGFFSLGRGKAFSTVEGGIIVTNSKQIAQQIEYSINKLDKPSAADNLKLIIYASALSVLAKPCIFWLPKSIPFLRLGETIYAPRFPEKHFSQLQACLAQNWRKRITFFQTQRKRNVLFWEIILSQLSWLKPIVKENNLLEMNFPLLRLPVLVQDKSMRNDLLEISEKLGLGIVPTYPDSVDKIKELKFEFKNEVFPGAKKCVENLVTFPVHPFMLPEDRQKIVEQLHIIEAMYTH